MPLRTTSDPAEVEAVITPALEADPVRNNILSTIRSVIRAGAGEPWCAYDGDALAVRGRPDTPVTLAGQWGAVDELAAELATFEQLDAVGGSVADVERVAAEMSARGRAELSRMSERLFRLDRLIEPAPVQGQARLATEDDVPEAARLFVDCMAEIWGRADDEAAAAEMVRGAITTTARLWFWEIDGTVVSFANGRVPAFGVARVGPVFTPPDLRGRGYASAVTAAASRDILEHDAVAVLYTDLANPTSNRIYQALGYVPVEDRLHVQYR
ncbi:MAG TPA: GNAT family N-acetyltransferase [Jatrophihabitantaceae bacterium]|nr:GNAT family N-acetyltransferase [Jatrophihabitantaceae bacterium]